MSDDKTPVDLEFKEEVAEALPVAVDDRAKRLERIYANQKLGAKSIKLRLNTYRVLKKQIDALGLRTIGQCTLLIGNDKVEDVLDELDGLAQEADKDAGSSKELRMELRRLKLDCIKVLLQSGTEQLRADRQHSEQPTVNNIQFPFPSGTPIAVAIGQKHVEKVNQIEDSDQKG